jgi:lycopene cyclase domain-containing protein
VARFQYLLLMAACLAGTLPLEFVYGAGVWRRPRRLLATLAIPVALFTVVDVLAIEADLWSFNPRFVTGWELPFGLPVEEVAFFFVIPVCAILAYEAVRRTLEGR